MWYPRDSQWSLFLFFLLLTKGCFKFHALTKSRDLNSHRVLLFWVAEFCRSPRLGCWQCLLYCNWNSFLFVELLAFLLSSNWTEISFWSFCFVTSWKAGLSFNNLMAVLAFLPPSPPKRAVSINTDTLWDTCPVLLFQVSLYVCLRQGFE